MTVIGHSKEDSAEVLEDSADRFEPNEPHGGPGSSRHVPGALWRNLWPGALCLVLYAVLAQLEYGYGNALGAGQMADGAGGDAAQALWFLAWPAYALSHGHNVFFSQWMNYPTGVNLLVNDSTPGLGILATPITLIVGPVVTWNVLVRLALVSSAFAMCMVLRRWTHWWPAAFVGGLFYGFSAYMLGQGQGHLYLTFVPLPPLIFLMIDEITVRQRWRPSRAGVLLGLLCVGQFLISVEVFVTTLILGVVLIAVLAVTARKEVPHRWHHGLIGASYAFGCGVVLLAYPIWYAAKGSAHLNGLPHSVQDLALYPGDLLGAVLPTHLMRFGTPAMLEAGSKLTGANLTENGMYLGFPLLILLIGFAFFLRRNRALLIAGAMAVIAYVLSLGPYLYVDGHATGVPMPESLLWFVGALKDLLPVRFSLFTAMFSAAMLAIGIGALHDRWTTPDLKSRTGRVIRSSVLLALVVAVALPLLPRTSYSSTPTGIPSFFSTTSVHAIRQGQVVLTYPYPNPSAEQPLLAQAVAGMRFKVFGGYAFVPADHGTPVPPPLSPPAVEELFNAAYQGTSVPIAETAATVEIRSFLIRYHVGAIVWEATGEHPITIADDISAVVGAPTTTGSLMLWLNVPERLRLRTLRTTVSVPANGSTVSGTTVLDAKVQDSVPVTKVEFRLTDRSHRDIVIAGVPSLVGWLAEWDTARVANGAYTMQSVAYDDAGETSESADTTITVHN
jgi:hypothetical protein